MHIIGWTSVGPRFEPTIKKLDTVWDLQSDPAWLVHHRDKTLALSRLGLLLSEKQVPQVVENIESGGNQKRNFERGYAPKSDFTGRTKSPVFNVFIFNQMQRTRGNTLSAFEPGIRILKIIYTA